MKETTTQFATVHQILINIICYKFSVELFKRETGDGILIHELK
jgi:hypothetical protein